MLLKNSIATRGKIKTAFPLAQKRRKNSLSRVFKAQISWVAQASGL